MIKSQSARSTSVKEIPALARKARSHIDEIDFIFAGSGISVAALDSELRIMEASGSFFDQFVPLPLELIGHDFVDLLHADTREHVRNRFAQLIMGERTRFVESLITSGRNDSACYGELVGVAAQDDVDPSTSVVVLVKTERMDHGERSVPPRKKLLSEMDARILEGVAAGESTVRLAAKLYLSRQGVEYHVCRMMRKFRVPNRAALVSKAYSTGMLRLREWPPRVFQECIK